MVRQGAPYELWQSQSMYRVPIPADASYTCKLVKLTHHD